MWYPSKHKEYDHEKNAKSITIINLVIPQIKEAFIIENVETVHELSELWLKGRDLYKNKE